MGGAGCSFRGRTKVGQKALVKNGFLRVTASTSIHALVEQSERAEHVISKHRIVLYCYVGTSAGVGTTFATSSAMQPLSEEDTWKIDEPTVEVRCHRHSAPYANLATYNAK